MSTNLEIIEQVAVISGNKGDRFSRFSSSSSSTNPEYLKIKIKDFRLYSAHYLWVYISILLAMS